MFGDTEDKIKEDLDNALQTYTVEDILEHNDLTIEDALFLLLNEGYIILPETKPV